MNEKDPSVLDKIDSVCNVLDRLVEAQGRANAGYIWVINDLMDGIKKDVLIMEEQLKDKSGIELTAGDIELGVEPVEDSETPST
jgi:hypothetical protein